MSLKKFVIIDLVITLALSILLAVLIVWWNAKEERKVQESIESRKTAEREIEAIEGISASLEEIMDDHDSCIEFNKMAIKPNPKGR